GQLAPCSFASYLIRLKAVGVAPNYLSYYINSVYGRRWVAENKSQQVGQANLSGGKLKTLGIPVPPMAEQQVIVERVEAALPAAKELATAGRGSFDSTALRQSILSLAFSGQLVPRDPGEEPALVLLERLRARKFSASISEKARAAPNALRTPHRRVRNNPNLPPL